MKRRALKLGLRVLKISNGGLRNIYILAHPKSTFTSTSIPEVAHCPDIARVEGFFMHGYVDTRFLALKEYSLSQIVVL
jgi:hypothetical protein